MSDSDLRNDKYDKYDDKYDKRTKCDDRYDKYDKYDKDNKKRKEVVLACGQVCDQYINVFECDKKCDVASLEIDLKHLKKPLVKLDFSSIVKFRDLEVNLSLPLIDLLTAANASFTLQLYRITNYCKKVCIGTWKYARYYNSAEDLLSVANGIDLGLFLSATSDSFSFTTCDEPKCDDCVLYSLEVKETTGLNIEIPFISKLILTQINFNAIAVDQW
ncbi:MAG: hypothetical protein CVV02_18345 [Firmicutes bacterium HGW-Firmicutes-7]|nr:MAG: hypothetical protein CVV02_18345 [Firmicutes bacterium HGW-Firmicutes-7]